MMIRLPGTVLLAALITLGLFYIMHVLVRVVDPSIDPTPPLRIADFRPTIEDTEYDTPRPQPPDIKKEPPPPPPPDLTVDPPQNPTGFRTRPAIPRELPPFDDRKHGLTADGDILPIVRVAAEYPQSAVAKGIEGYVDFRFTISKTGAVVDPVVIASEPPGVFEKAATKALSRWKYKPRVENGEPVERPGVEVRMRFYLGD